MVVAPRRLINERRRTWCIDSFNVEHILTLEVLGDIGQEIGMAMAFWKTREQAAVPSSRLRYHDEEP